MGQCTEQGQAPAHPAHIARALLGGLALGQAAASINSRNISASSIGANARDIERASICASA